MGLLRLCVMNGQDVVADCAYMSLFHDNDCLLTVDPTFARRNWSALLVNKSGNK